MKLVSMKLGAVSILLILVGGVACSRENLLTLPAPAPAIAGRYVGRAGYFPLPIPGDSVTITLTSVASDTVDVVMQATTNGKPGAAVPFGRRLVVQDFSVGACVSYVVPLNPGRDSSALYMTCSQINVLQYVNALPRYRSGRSAQFVKL